MTDKKRRFWRQKLYAHYGSPDFYTWAVLDHPLGLLIRHNRHQRQNPWPLGAIIDFIRALMKRNFARANYELLTLELSFNLMLRENDVQKTHAPFEACSSGSL